MDNKLLLIAGVVGIYFLMQKKEEEETPALDYSLFDSYNWQAIVDENLSTILYDQFWIDTYGLPYSYGQDKGTMPDIDNVNLPRG